MTGRTIRDLLNAQAPPGPTRDQADLARVRAMMDGDTLVNWLEAPLGSGAQELLGCWMDEAQSGGRRVFRFDCRTVEPTPSGLLDIAGSLLDARFNSLEQLASAISGSGERVVLVFEYYEVFRLADSWLRQDFIPALAEHVRVLLVSREPPSAGWRGAMEWAPHFGSLSLASANPEQAAENDLGALARLGDPDLRQAVESMAVVRRVTRPMLSSLCENPSVETAFDALAELPYVDRRSDGLALREPMRQLLASRLQAEDPQRYRGYQRAAWALLRQQLHEASRADLWRYTADTIYLLENPVIREAFFPSTTSRYAVEPAAVNDQEAIFDIIAAHEPPASVTALEEWWRHLPEGFHVVRDETRKVVGFYCIAGPDNLGADWLQRDPVARAWQSHLFRAGKPVAPALFLRRWLGRDDGEAPGPVQAAAWVDIKRIYLELRPALRRVYLGLRDLAPYAAPATQLGFQVLGELGVSPGGVPVHTAMLDFGPGSVDGWICRLLAEELGVVDSQRVDPATRAWVDRDEVVPLTPLEFDFLSLLDSRPGEAIERETLLHGVWGRGSDHASNVVDALVAGLRRKSGSLAECLETVRGVGYRLRQ